MNKFVMNKEKFPYTCCNCKQIFSISRGPNSGFVPRNPLLVKCGHSVCEVCVRNGLKTNGTVVCSLCATVTVAKDGQLDTLRKEFPFFRHVYGAWTLRNFYDQPDGGVSFNLNNLRSNMKNESRYPHCFDCPLQAFFVCDQCEVNYCKNCFDKVHMSKPGMKHHTKSKTKPNNAQVPKRKPTFQVNQILTCLEHENKPKEFYCLDHEISVCAHCAIFYHSGHAVESVAKRNIDAIPKLQESMRKAIEVLARIKRIKKGVSSDSPVKKIQEDGIRNLEIIEKEVMSRFSLLYGIVQIKEHDILNKIREEKANLADTNSHLEEQLMNSMSNIESVLQEAKEAINKKGQNTNIDELQKGLDSVTLSAFSQLAIENGERSEEHSYKLETVDDKDVRPRLNSFLDQVFKLECPKIPKVKLVPTKDVLEAGGAGDSTVDLDSIANIARFYGVPQDDAELDTEPEPLKSISRVSFRSEKIDKNEKYEASMSSLCRPLAALKEGSAEMVQVSHINSPSDFYIQRKGVEIIVHDNILKFKRLVTQNKLQTPSSVSKGGIFLVHYAKDDNWYRGKVVRTNIEDAPDKIEVLYIDYGNRELVDLESFRLIPARLIQEPPHALQCSLFDCHPRNEDWSLEALKVMADLTLKSVMVHVMNTTETALEVDVVRISETNHVSVRDALIFLELASFLPFRTPAKVEAPKTQLCAKSGYNKGDVIECQVTHAESPGEFYCVEIDEHYRQLLELMNEMSDLYSNPFESPEVIYNPVIGMPVAAKFSEDHKWYRAVITNLPGKRMIDVFYVDFGNKERVSYLAVRPLLTKFLRMNTQAIHCSLADIQPKKSKKWPDAATKIMDDLVYEPAHLVVEEVTVTNNQPHVKVVLFLITPTADICINALLVQEDAAVSTGVNSTIVSFARVHNAKKLSKLQGLLCNENSLVPPTSDEPDSSERPTKTYLQNAVENKVEKTKKKVDKKTAAAKKTSKRKLSSCDNDNDNMSCSASMISTISTAHTVDSIDSDEAHRIEVRVLSASSPSQIYVRLHNDEVEDYINKLNASLDEFYTGSVPNSIVEWKKGGICVAFNTEDGHWYRSVIRQIEGDSAQITMKDIGKECTVNIEHLRIIEEKFIKGFIDGSIRCHLAGVLAAGGNKWASYACERFAEELAKYPTVFITKKGTIDVESKSLPVELWVKHVILGGALEPDIEEWRSMNAFVVQQGIAIPDRTFEQYVAHAEDWLTELKQMQIDSSSNINSEDFVLSWLQNSNDDRNSIASDADGPELGDQSVEGKKKKSKRILQETITEWKPAKPLDKLDLKIIPSNVDNNNMIYFHEEDRADTLKQIEQALLQKYSGSKPQPQDMWWSAGQPCIAQYHNNNMWYRGKIIKVNEDSTYAVQFVDYGNMEECKATELRKRVFLTDLPLYCHTLYVEDLKPVSDDGKWPIQVLDFIHSNVVEKVCHVKLKEPEQPGGSYIATSFAPPGGIELRDILLGMHYALPASAASDDSNSTISDSDEGNDSDVVIIESKDQEEEDEDSVVDDIKNKEIDESSLQLLTQKWVDDSKDRALEKSASSVDENVSDYISPKLSPADVAAFSELTKLKVGEPLFNHSGSSNSSLVGTNPSNVDGKNTNPISGLPFDSLKMAPLSLQSIMLESGDSIGEILAPKVNSSVSEEDDDDESFKMPQSESEMKRASCENIEQGMLDNKIFVFSKAAKNRAAEKPATKISAKEFGDFLELPVPQCKELSVEVTAIQSLTSFYVQVTQTTDEFLNNIQEQYVEMYKEIQEYAPSGRALMQPFRNGQECVALYDDDENWYRAVIATDCPVENEEQVMVRFVDFGNKQATAVKNIRPLKRRWLDIPRQCFRVVIHDYVLEQNADLEIVFKFLTENIFCPLKAVIKDYVSPLGVDLFKEGTVELVYQPLIDAGILVKVESPDF